MKVMTLSMMKAGQWRFQLAPGNFTEVIHRAICDVTTQAAMHHVQIEAELPETASTMLDREQMHGVVRAILENAIRFSPAAARIAIRVWRDDRVFCLTVTDRGAGIDSDFLPRVFEEFTDADVSHHTAGHGLSLAIARLVVLAHHGTIGVESTPGGGTTFTVRLPVAEGQPGY
jgi:signal transduction histidine kinase